MTGQYAHNIDAKGRLFIPSKLREELGDVFYVTVGQDGCLSVHSDQSWQELRDKLRDTSYTETKTLRAMSALAARCEPDAQGRILLPQRLRQYAQLEKEVIIIGVFDRAEIWNAQRWTEIEDEALNSGSLEKAMQRMGAVTMELHHNVQEDLSYGHRPVLLEECLDALCIRPDGVYVDGTLGRAGHSLEIARRLTTGHLIGIDRDETAITAAKERLRDYLDHVTLVHSNFDRIGEILEELNIPGVDGMLFDLGVSSPQLDDAARGFSYMHDAPLDMRMDRTAALDARQVVNRWLYEELRHILYDFGEERYAPAIARGICRAREIAPVETTLQLVGIIKSSMPPQALREKQHPARRSFQAIRIAVNGELDALPPMLNAGCEHLNVGGRLAVISFHSLEDRIIKKTMQELATGCTCPPNFPVCVCGKKPKMKLISRKPIVPGEAELTENPRARSARLRVAEKL